MSDPTEDEINERKKREGKGRVGGAAGGASGQVSGVTRFAITAEENKAIWAQWKQLSMSEAVSAVAEFFSELPARASANLQVKFDSATKAGFAVVTKFIAFGQDVAGAMRTRTREATAVIRRKYGINIKVKRGGQTIVAPNPAIS